MWLHVSVLFSEPKIPQALVVDAQPCIARVSVLFSEPKIPQYVGGSSDYATITMFQCSSASRKFLNVCLHSFNRSSNVVFQCSSASRKFLNLARVQRRQSVHLFQCSSASRKFLNAVYKSSKALDETTFQCSSASRKFLNSHSIPRAYAVVKTFSALQRAENSSIAQYPPDRDADCRLSVLFSEPKIPQFFPSTLPRYQSDCAFSALQRAENSSIRTPDCAPRAARAFQCSSASRKFLN